MFISKMPSIPQSSKKLPLTSSPTALDTKSRYCYLTVVSGNAYITGMDDAPATVNSFKLLPDVVYEFAGYLSLVSDTAGADVRVLYYDVI